MMGEEIVSMVSNGGTSIIEEVSDSNSSSDPSLASKHARNGGNIFTSKLRGVVPQPNGHWGCQIYANHQRIWLGTFKSEKEAAMAYDSAALKLRNGDCRRNFPLTNMTVEEPNFQSHYSTEALLSMIKDGTYQSKLEDFVRTRSQKVEAEFSLKLNKTGSNRKLTCKQLFQKELTPSDVGKLNRLVIPKKYAVKFFSHMSKGVGENVGVNKVNDGQLAFYDKSMKLWKFRYCYWRSSQSYVFTRGWNRFVKEKQLKANDTIAICLCECSENSEVTQTYYMINVLNGENNSSNLLELSDKTGMQLQLELRRISSGCDNIERNKSLTAGMELRLSPPPKHIMEGKGLIMESKVRNVADRKSFRLFGTEII